MHTIQLFLVQQVWILATINELTGIVKSKIKQCKSFQNGAKRDVSAQIITLVGEITQRLFDELKLEKEFNTLSNSTEMKFFRVYFLRD